eukprot:TRINITY_DN2415_c0_g1_i14.p6 TRINITY_DN2415_c0_g1~~TRINITY_DN2415_c0_g1_i14.p6  ORF type:complete len:120 (-),score=0.69 TRINITY_DN2415_c0_g1_i14:109-468(-)
MMFIYRQYLLTKYVSFVLEVQSMDVYDVVLIPLSSEQYYFKQVGRQIYICIFYQEILENRFVFFFFTFQIKVVRRFIFITWDKIYGDLIVFVKYFQYLKRDYFQALNQKKYYYQFFFFF